MKSKLDLVLDENKRLKKENEDLKCQLQMQDSRMNGLENKLDSLEQDKLKDDVIITIKFEVSPLSPASISSFVNSQSGGAVSVSPNSITNFHAIKTKQGDTVLKVSISNQSERISLLKNKKRFSAVKKIFINEALTAQKYKLLMAAKSLCKEQKAFSTWSRGGRIFIKIQEESVPLLVTSQNQLFNLF